MVPPERPGRSGLIRWRRAAAIALAAALVANLLYAAKSLMKIDFVPGHHGGYFPLGDWILRSFRS